MVAQCYKRQKWTRLSLKISRPEIKASFKKFESNLKIWKNPATQTKALSSKEGDMYTAL